MVSVPRRDEVWLIRLDPSQGAEIKKTRPCLIVSPDEMNEALFTVLVAPMTTALRSYPTRVNVSFQGKKGQVALDQMRAIDRERLIHKMGTLPVRVASAVSDVLLEMFAR